MSAVLCATVCVLWVRSYADAAGVVWLGRRTEHRVHSYGGAVAYVYVASTDDIPSSLPHLNAYWNGRFYGGDVKGVIDRPPYLSRGADFHDASSLPERWVDLDGWEGSDTIGLDPFLSGAEFLFGASPPGPYPETHATAVGAPHWLFAAAIALAPALR